MKKKKISNSTILSCIAIGGVIGTAVLSAITTPKAMKILEKEEKDSEEPLSKLDKALLIAPAYIPVMISGVATTMCILGANVLNKKQQASLISAYTMVSDSYNHYRKKLIELYGKEADVKIRESIILTNCCYHQTHVDEPDEKIIFYDEISDRSVRRYEKEILDALYHFNRNFVLHGAASLNDLYQMIGLEPVEFGDDIGWSVDDGYYWVDFEIGLISQDDGGETVYAINPVFSPHEFEEW